MEEKFVSWLKKSGVNCDNRAIEDVGGDAVGFVIEGSPGFCNRLGANHVNIDTRYETMSGSAKTW